MRSFDPESNPVNVSGIITSVVEAFNHAVVEVNIFKKRMREKKSIKKWKKIEEKDRMKDYDFFESKFPSCTSSVNLSLNRLPRELDLIRGVKPLLSERGLEKALGGPPESCRECEYELDGAATSFRAIDELCRSCSYELCGMDLGI